MSTDKNELDRIAKQQIVAKQDRADRDLAKKLGADVDEMRKAGVKAMAADTSGEPPQSAPTMFDPERSLTNKQREIMRELPETGTLECLPPDKRSAEALAKKGLIKILGPSRDGGYFEITRTSCMATTEDEPKEPFALAKQWLQEPQHNIGLPVHVYQDCKDSQIVRPDCVRCGVEIALSAYASECVKRERERCAGIAHEESKRHGWNSFAANAVLNIRAAIERGEG